LADLQRTVYPHEWSPFSCRLSAEQRKFAATKHTTTAYTASSINGEEVTLQLIQSKSVSLLLYGIEAFPLNKFQLNSLDFVISRFFMKLFETSDKNIVESCQENLGFNLPSTRLDKKRNILKEKYMNT